MPVLEYIPERPIYLQIMEHFRQQIASGTLQPGDRLPSVRDLAVSYGVNPNTMQRALTELEREGLLYTERTAGRFITQDQQTVDRQRQMAASGYSRRYVGAMRDLGYTRDGILSAVATALDEPIEEEKP